MDSLEEESNEHNMEKLAGQLPPQGSPGAEEIYDELPVLPRIGGEYQVEIPSLATEAEHHQLKLSQVDKGIGLAIPIMWCSCQSNAEKHEEKQYQGSNACSPPPELHNCKSNKESAVDATCINSRIGDSDSKDGSANGREDVREVTKPTSPECASISKEQREAETNIPLPGTSASSWSHAEMQSFLLGLYIFGKNLILVRKFVESMTMGEVLSFYYGKFFKSDAYRRWSECRKIRSRRCILGRRIFTGWRQQELLSRLLPSIPQEIHDSLLEAVKNFNEVRTSFEEFIFALKSLVSMQALTEAVGIGKGKNDLTRMVMDPVRTNLGISVRPEIPVGKACSSLTSGDIIKFLMGDFRLSKARSNDLFWEAVWPRLLARGWHSEQPKYLSAVGSKNPLVFLMPGIKKFSRKKLVKGNHYFDSVTDVLNKVVSDPRLLELEVIVSDENAWADDTKPDQNVPSEGPRIQNYNSELMKFTIVDTSLVLGEGPVKVRELRTLPVDATFGFQFLACSGEAVSDSSTEQSKSDDSSDDQEESANELENMITGSTSIMLVNGHGSSEQLLDVLDSKKCSKDTTCHFSRSGKSGQHEYLSPVSKRRRLTPCKNEGAARLSFSFSKGDEVKKGEGEGPTETTTKLLKEEFRSATLIDLNLPHMPPDCEAGKSFPSGNQDRPSTTGEAVCTVEAQNLNCGSRIPENHDEMQSDQQHQTNSRRQSTRSRPPTAKALEALACGFLGTKRKSRDMRATPFSRPSRRARRRVEEPVHDPPANCDKVVAGIEDSGAMFVKKEKRDPDPTISSDDHHGRPLDGRTHNFQGLS